MLLKDFKIRWHVLSQTAVWLIAVLSVFVFTPPVEVGSDAEGTLKSFAGFVLTVTMGSLAIPLNRYGKRKWASRWAVIMLITLAVGSILFFLYQDRRRVWSAQYDDLRVVVGSELTDSGKAYMESERSVTNEQAVLDSGGQPSLIWTSASIHKRAKRLQTIYVALLISLSLTAIFAVQCSYCVLHQVKSNKAVAKRKSRNSRSKAVGT